MRNEVLRVICRHCGHQWVVRSELKIINCPSCRKPNNNPNWRENKNDN